ncbi:MAG: class I SAM-dependent methyltransferase [bacterium]|nr:class I SAM-dependent methyltransferase [bacterium]
MNDNLGNIYSHHHETSRERGFSILKDERGALIKNLIGRDKLVLDIGCRDGALTRYFTDGNQVLGIDIDSNALKEAEKLGIKTMSLDLNGEWPELEGGKFDVVVAGEVLEHLYYPDKVAAKVVKHLVPGGMFVGSVPNAFSLKNRLRYLLGRKAYTPLSDPTHINQFHIDELRSILERHFACVEIMGLGRYQRLAKTFPGLFGFDLFFVATL